MKRVKWLEVSVTADPETAEAVVELFNRYGRGQAVVETPVDCFEYELEESGPPASVIVKTYLSLDGSPLVTAGDPTSVTIIE